LIKNLDILMINNRTILQ